MNRLRVGAAVLLVVAAGLFALGTSIEKSRHHDETAGTTQSGEAHNEGGESAEHREAEAAETHAEGGSEEGTILGIDREATGLVVFAVVASLALAALVWRRPTRLVWSAVALASLAFAVFDIAEVTHQINESVTGLAVLAAAVGVAHLGAAATAIRGLTSPTAAT